MAASPDYDLAGDQTDDGVNSYLYDAEGRVCAVASTPVPGYTTMTGYIYDGVPVDRSSSTGRNAEGERVAKGSINQWSCDPTTNGFKSTTEYVLGPGGGQMSEMAPDANNRMVWQRSYVYAAGQLIATYDPRGVHFRLTDWLGTQRVTTNYEGVAENTCTGQPYGDGQNCSNDSDPHHFTGKERDTESGNDYFGARYYASTMGRFLSPDWSAKEEPVPYAKLDDPQTLNLYAYVGNNPLGGVDKDGHATWYDQNGHRLGTDGINDGGVVVAKASEVSYSPDHSLIDVADSGLPMFSFTRAEGNAIQSSVDRTLAPAGGDHQGGFHEEGFTEDASGIHNKAPGPAYEQGDATAHINGTINSSTTMDEHTHPVGTQDSGGTTFGGTHFDPEPSPQDHKAAAGWDNVTHVEASAGSNTVYIYDSGKKPLAQLPLSAFPRAQH